MNKQISILLTGVALITVDSAFAMLNDDLAETATPTLTISHAPEGPDSLGRKPGSPNYGSIMPD